MSEKTIQPNKLSIELLKLISGQTTDGARAFSGEVETGSPQKMRPLKDN
jgi:hypothetical protein